MAGNLGTLTADLVLETAAFMRGIKQATDATAKATRGIQQTAQKAERGFAWLGTFARGGLIGAGIATVVGGLKSVSNAAIDAGEHIGETAKKLGIGVEQLQRFEAAANNAHVGTGQLATALKAIQARLAEGLIEGESTEQAFESAIQKITEANNQIEKAKIARENFGRQWQIALAIATQGWEQFKQSQASAIVITEQGIKNAEEFHRSVEKTGAAFTKAFNVGFLEQFNVKLDDSAEGLRSTENAARLLGRAVGLIAEAAIIAINAIGKMISLIKSAASYVGSSIIGSASAAEGGGFGVQTFGASSGRSGGGLPMLTEQANKAAEAQRNLGSAAQSNIGIISELDAAIQRGAATTKTMSDMSQMTANQLTQGWLDVAGTVGGAFQTLFADNKAVAIAMAVINTAQAITAALAQYPPPLSFAMAAAQAAAGAAQIATIASARPGSSAKPNVKSGGGKAKKMRGAEESVSGGGTRTSITLEIKGDVFGPEHFKKMVKGINGAVSDGSVLVRMT